MAYKTNRKDLRIFIFSLSEGNIFDIIGLSYNA